MTSMCEKCYKMEESETWSPSGESLVSSNFTLDYFYLLHMVEAEVTGAFYEKDVCVDDSTAASHCLTDLFMFAIESADPGMAISADGYLGLGLVAPGDSYQNSSSYSTLEQLKSNKLIDDLIFGFYSASWTGGTSSLRLGGYNTFYMADPSQINYINTTSNDSWTVPLLGVYVDKTEVLNITNGSSKALMNPSFPLIAAPWNEFLNLQAVWNSELKDLDIQCPETSTWCYFEKSCDDVKNHIKPINFQIGSSDSKGDYEYYVMEPESFLIQITGDDEDSDTCHIGIFGQAYSDVDYWILGDLFMHDFYTIFDATDSSNPKVGLTLSSHAENARITTKQFDGVNVWEWVILCVVMMTVTVCLCFLCLRCKKRRENRRAERAKELVGEGCAINSDDSDQENGKAGDAEMSDEEND